MPRRRQLDIEAYLVGGFVRDRLLGGPLEQGHRPGDGRHRPDAVARRRGSAGSAGIRPSGSSASAPRRSGDRALWSEGVRARAERYDPSSRNPEVRPGTLEEDVMRRDFTVNALCQTLDGRMIDITGRGLADLRAGILRTPLDPAVTFAEDPLRMYRAARFVAQLGFTLAPGTVEAMRAQAGTEPRSSRSSGSPTSSAGCSVPRIRAPASTCFARQGCSSTCCRSWFPAIGVEQGGFHTFDVFDHTVAAVDAAPHDLVTRTAALLHDIGKPSTHVVAPDGTAHLLRPRADRRRHGARHPDPLALQQRRDQRGEPARATPPPADPVRARILQRHGGAPVDRRCRRSAWALLDLARADTTASAYPTLAELDELEERMDRLDEGGAVSSMRDPLTGDQLMVLAGRGPGPWVGRAKAPSGTPWSRERSRRATPTARAPGSTRTESCCAATERTFVRRSRSPFGGNGRRSTMRGSRC